jgi:putative zinc finger/helix-turn-helix YgiT family protein
VTQKHECFECGQFVTPRVEERTETLPVRGEPTEVLAKVAVCPDCGCDLSVEELDNATLVAAFNSYRREHGLMTPEQMRRLRERYGLGVRPFSLLLGWGEITLHRYENGSLQDPAHEAALRLAEDPPNMRVYLRANAHKLTARQRARLEAHLQAIEAGERAAAAPELTDRFVVREERDGYGGWAPMQLSKLREMMVFFARAPKMYETKLNKLLFYADFAHYKAHSVSISGSPYLAFQHGPVPQHYPWIEADLVDGGDISVEEVFFRDGGSGTVLESLREPDLSLFDAEELATLRRVEAELGGDTSRQLSDRSHRERAWTETPTREMIPYEMARDLSL